LLGNNYDSVFLEGKYNRKFYLFFDGDILRKVVEYFISSKVITVHEMDVCYKTIENRSIVLPKTKRGKPRKLNVSAINSFSGEGNYFYIMCNVEDKTGKVVIGNYTTQKTFYEDDIVDCGSFEDIKNWCDQFVQTSTEDDLKDVQAFMKEKRQHVVYKAGDYFRVKLGRHQYTYGRILLDIYKSKKNGLQYWNVLAGHPLLVETFHILTERSDVTVQELENLPVFPSQHIMDNRFYYGEYPIIGHGDLPDIIKYPVMYGRSISALSRDKMMFQCGTIYKEMTYSPEIIIRRDDFDLFSDFRNNGIGFGFTNNQATIKKCIEAKSNVPYWLDYPAMSKKDLRSVENREYLKAVLKQVDLEGLLEVYRYSDEDICLWESFFEKE
ncbi:MAG: immunity 26/phosphotriesterase HocA family protein, partial [Bacilli bacterium]|nr:immunity 26/phosphotriesterase HocA family protein [Bacilli bacterium]